MSKKSKKEKVGLPKKELQLRLDELDAHIEAGNPLIVANALRKAAKKRGIPVMFGLIIKKKTYDATLFLKDRTINVTLGSGKRKVTGSESLKYETNVDEFIGEALGEWQ